MNKYAFFSGVNLFASGNNLKGCVNDCIDVRERLVKKYQFAPDNIRVLTDYRATAKAEIEHLDWLIGCCSPTEHDLLVWQNSSHGTRYRIRHGDNLDNYEQDVICPSDFDWDNNYISTDMIHERLNRIPQNTVFVLISDSCASGNLVKQMKQDTRYKTIVPPEDIAARSLDRNLVNKRIDDYVAATSSVNVVFLSGCQSDETSADAFINGRYNGALTAGLKEVIDGSPNVTWKCAHALILRYLREGGFEQHPELKGGEGRLLESLFT